MLNYIYNYDDLINIVVHTDNIGYIPDDSLIDDLLIKDNSLKNSFYFFYNNMKIILEINKKGYIFSKKFLEKDNPQKVVNGSKPYRVQYNVNHLNWEIKSYRQDKHVKKPVFIHKFFKTSIIMIQFNNFSHEDIFPKSLYISSNDYSVYELEFSLKNKVVIVLNQLKEIMPELHNRLINTKIEDFENLVIDNLITPEELNIIKMIYI